ARRRRQPARVRQPSLQRSQQSAAAGGVADHGPPPPRQRGLLWRRKGDGADLRSGPQPSQERLRLWCPLPRAVRHRLSRRRRAQHRRHAAGFCRFTCFLVSRAAVMHTRTLALISFVSIAAIAGFGAVSATSPHFYPDDPLVRQPEPQDASGAAPSNLDLMYELSYNLFALPRHKPSGVRAQNLNTSDEVPDSSWFTNRIGTTALSIDEVVRGPVNGPPPDPSRW